MGKTGKKRKNLADKIRKARSTKPVKGPSAFDLHINKQKHDILGRNQAARGQVGNPVQSRSRAIEQRRKTLLKEYKSFKKSNVFKDERLGETTDRLALERKSEHQRLFSQEEEGEEEELTHLGQSVSEIEKFDETLASDSDEEDGRLGGDVAKEFFGGYLKEKESEKTWKERMAELISQTKKEKYERQSEKDRIQKKIEEVDAEFKSIHHLLMSKRPGGADKEKPKPDDFDIKVRMQQFEIKGTPLNRLKSDEELAKEEAERLKKLEEDRKRRMKGELASSETPAHISADSLEDGFSYSYAPTKTTQSQDDADDQEEENSDDDNSDEEGGGKVDEDDENEDDSDGEEDEEDSDDDSDIDDDEDEEEAEKAVEELLKKKMEKKKSAPKAPVVDPEEQRKAAEEIPYTFTAPEDQEDLVLLLSPYCPDDQVTVLERLVACYHPSLAEGNKQKLQLLFSLLLQYLMDLMSQGHDPPVPLMDKLTPLLHQLLRHDPDGGSKTVLQMVLNRYNEFEQNCQRRGGRGSYMGLDSMLLLKLVQVLFPTSDFQHPVVTPAFHFITAMLGQTPVQTGRDIAAGLYLCALCTEYVCLSKRYVPEAINFLHGILFLAATKDAKKVQKVFPPFRPVGKFTDLLKVQKEVQEVGVLSLQKTLASDTEDLETDEFRVSCISACVALLQEFAHLYSSLPAARAVFASVLEMLNNLPTTDYPQGLQECVDKLLHSLKKDAEQPLEALTLQKERPQPLKLIDPKMDEVFDGRKKRKGTREQLERQRLKHKVKKEFKGALREIRKDTQFLANQKLEETKKKDAERQGKLKRIYADLSNQEGEVRALKRLKNRTSD
ncbi:nucleolar protein 14-like [Babylonia areolata]|uniref:nucleolar protein 14-like n=1 Tax=Babylonia areolata TaxID=304850 RepID=UPI003FD0374C